MMFRNVIFAARHRGLTSWAWTYNTEELFAQDYLFGGTYSMTTNFSTWATNLPAPATWCARSARGGNTSASRSRKRR